MTNGLAEVGTRESINGAVIDTIRRISGEEPVIFQRDYRIMAASRAGFGMVDYGLPTNFRDWEERERYREDEPEPEARKYSEPIAFDVKSPGRDSTLVGESDELAYFQPLVMDPEGRGFTLGEMAKIAEIYSELPADGKVRMINHDSGYHSHKYGYAEDGMDVVPTVGRVMPLEKFLELVGNAEEANFESMGRTLESLKQKNYWDRPDSFDVYGNHLNPRLVNLPDAYVLTPNLFVSFIRKGLPNIEGNNDRWSRDTLLGTSPYAKFERFYSSDISPFRIDITVNSRNIKPIDADHYAIEQGRITKDTIGELKEIDITAKLMGPVLEELNGFHNDLFSE